MVATICCYCGVGCGIRVERNTHGAWSLQGNADYAANRGHLCSKGRSLLHAARNQQQRLRTPLVRGEDGVLHPASWDEALAAIAKGFGAILTQYGPDALGLYVSGQCLTEEYYLANKLARAAWGTNNIDTNSRLCMSSAVVGYKQTLGSDAVPCSYADLELAETVLVCGANPAWCHPVLFQRFERSREERAQRLLVIDPRRTASAEVADLHLALRPGTDVPLYLGLLQLLQEQGDWDEAFIAAHVHGAEALRTACAAWPLARCAAVTGLDPGAIRQAAQWIGGGRRLLSLWAMGLNQARDAVARNVALIDLHLVSGQIGKPGCGPFSLTGQPNAMGGREVGGMATILPGHRDPANAAHRAEVASIWGIPALPERPGLTAMEQIAAIEAGTLRGLWVMATNPVESLPNAERCERALKQLQCLVVSDMAPTATTALAHVVLPAATWLEKRGTMTNSERRMGLLQPALPAPGEARADWWIICAVAKAMGYADLFAYPDEAAVFAAHARMTKGRDCDISGLSYARLEQQGSVQWPCPEATHPGTERLFTDHRFAFPDGKARVVVPTWSGEGGEGTDAQYPLVLTTGRLRDQWHTMTRTGRVARLQSHQDRPWLDIHPLDAQHLGITDQAVVSVTSRRGTLRVRARLDERQRTGVVFLPMHWGRQLAGPLGRVNNLTDDQYDPISREPAFKRAAVHVAPYHPPLRRIVVVGAGAAAFHLVQQLRAGGSQDHLIVVGEEPEPIYNRVALPHLVEGSQRWSDLVTGDHDWASSMQVELRRGCRVEAIDRGAKQVQLADGRREPYDILVLATGSAPRMPERSGPLEMGLRTRADAERILQQAQPGSTVFVVGAGLLGLELAEALRARGCTVLVASRGERVMGRQLDATASAHLVDILRARGLDLRLNTKLVKAEAHGDGLQVHLSDGSSHQVALVVHASGTVPNDQLAKAAGIDCAQGVVIDAQTWSSDPYIAALGEVAVYGGERFGTTAAAGAMAKVLAEHLLGDPFARWNGWVDANILKVPGVQLASVGRVEVQDTEDETITLHDPARHWYRRLIVRHDRLIGALCLGDLTGFDRYRELVATGLELEEERGRLLGGGAAAKAMRGRVVCSCKQVGDDDIREAIAGGACDVAAVGKACGAGTVCGSCRGEVRRLLSAAQSGQAV